MARPKRPRPRSAKALARSFRKAQRKRGVVFLGSSDFYMANGAAQGAGGGSGGSVIITSSGTNTTNNAAAVTLTATGGSGQLTAVNPGFIRIESLDQGVTWHVADTMEPVANQGGELVIGTTRCGQAPVAMTAGSGTYDFQIESRWATQDEAAVWWANHLAESEVRNREWKEGEEKRRLASERARQLLRSHLSALQRQDLELKGGFWITSQFGNRYWVTPNTAVRFDARGVALQRYCIHAVDTNIPGHDNALLRMLLLKCDEEAFLKTANPSPPSKYDFRRPPAPIVTLPRAVDYIAPARGTTAVRGVTVGAGGNATGVVQVTNGANFTAIALGPPIVRYINGVFRPLCG